MAKRKTVNRIVAHLPGVKEAVHAKGREIQARAEALFDEHDRPGGHHIVGEVVGRQADYLVSIEGPTPHIIEFGREGYITNENFRGGAGVEIGPMEGLHILGRAVEE